MFHEHIFSFVNFSSSQFVPLSVPGLSDIESRNNVHSQINIFMPNIEQSSDFIRHSEIHSKTQSLVNDQSTNELPQLRRTTRSSKLPSYLTQYYILIKLIVPTLLVLAL